jgi:release factor glutamine methyltransferase
MPAGPFDLVLANPPYIPTAALAGLAPEVVRYDPIRALDGGPDGLDAYRSLAPAIAGSLTQGGYAVVELGEGQGAPVADLFLSSGLETVARRADLAGIPRCLIVQSGPKKPFGDSAGAD